MRKKRLLKVLYFFELLTFFLPWFSYNPKIMGYCWGFEFITWFILPFAILAIYLFGKKETMISVLAEISSIINIVLSVIIFGRWQEKHNIIEGYHFADGFKTAQPAFYGSFFLFLTFCILLQYTLIKERANEI